MEIFILAWGLVSLSGECLPPLPEAEPKVVHPALKPRYVPVPGFSKPFQSGSYTLLCNAVEPVEIAERCPDELNRSHSRL